MHGLDELLRAILAEPRDGRVASHPSGVRAPVVVEQPLEVLRRGKRERVRAVAEREERDLLAFEQLLDDDVSPESPRSGQAPPASSASVSADEDALSRRQPVGLDDAGCPRLVELASGRHSGGLQDLLGEGLRALDARCRGARSEDRRPAARSASASPSTSGASGPMTTRSIREAPAEVEQRSTVVRPDGMAGSEPGDPGIAGGGVELAEERALRDPPRERVFAAAAADDEDVHAASLVGRPGIRPVCVAEAGTTIPLRRLAAESIRGRPVGARAASRRAIVLPFRVSAPRAAVEEAEEGMRADRSRSLRQREGSQEKISEVRKRINDLGITYIYYQFPSVTGRIMGKGVPAPHWETIAEKGFQLVYGATANLFTDRHGNYIGYGPEAAELVGVPEPETFMPLPWDSRVARVWVTCFRNREEREDPGRLPHLGLLARI